MPYAIRIHKNGGPEVLVCDEVAVGEPGPGEARVRHHAVGLNFIDILFRSGLYPSPSFPASIGMEAAGVVEAVGANVTHVRPGDRVVYAGGGNGAYSDVRVLPAGVLVKLPETISFDQGAAMLLKGLTAQYLIKQSYPVKAGDAVLFTAVAGGVGLFAAQWLKALGATVIGTVSNDAKAKVALAHGCAHAIVSPREDTVARVKELTDGKGVAVVYDSIGKDTWESSLNCLKQFGFMINFGNASGPIPPVNLAVLSQKGSIYVQRPTLMTYIGDLTRMRAMAADLFDIVASGKVKVNINHRYALKDAAMAHADLEGRRTTGSVVMTP